MTPTSERPDGTLEHRRQQAAERAVDGAAADPAVAQYRAVYEAVRQAPMPPMPAGFAAALGRAVETRPRTARDERVHWSTLLGTLLLLALLAVGLAIAWPGIARQLATLRLMDGPWPVLVAAAGALLLLELQARATAARRRPGRGA